MPPLAACWLVKKLDREGPTARNGSAAQLGRAWRVVPRPEVLGSIGRHTLSGGRSTQAGGGANACLPLSQDLASTRVSGSQGAGGSLTERLTFPSRPLE